jgi:hypothetical protein
MPCNSDLVGDTHGRGRCEASRRIVPQKTNRPGGGNAIRVRVKRCGKSAPREAQATRHGKPHRVQGQIGNLRSGPLQFPRKRSGFRVLAAKTNDSLPGAIRADRNRLTALPKPSLSGLGASLGLLWGGCGSSGQWCGVRPVSAVRHACRWRLAGRARLANQVCLAQKSMPMRV